VLWSRENDGHTRTDQQASPQQMSSVRESRQQFLSGFEQNMPLHRYIDATKFDLVLGRIPAPAEPASIHSVTSLAAQALEEIAPVRSWAKREETEHLPRMTAKAVSEAISEFPAETDMEVAIEKTEPLKAKETTEIVKNARGRPKGSKNKK